MIERQLTRLGHMYVAQTCASGKTHGRDDSGYAPGVVVLLIVSAVLARSATNDVKIGTPDVPGPDQPKSVITERSDSSDLRLGKGDWVVRGPVVDSFRRPRTTENRSLGRRILELPIIRLFVPKPTPPSDAEVYLVEGKSSRPWAAIASDAHRLGSPDNPLFLEGGCALVTIGR